MSLLGVHDIRKSFGAHEVLRGAGFHLGPGERAGLVGVNGCGKTTLLEIISGKLRPDSGSVSVSKETSVGYLKQSAGLSGDNTVLGEALSARPEVPRLRKRLTAAAETVAGLAGAPGADYDAAMEEYGALLAEFEKIGGYAYEGEAAGALAGLGFAREEFGRRVGTLSGGERTRLALARLLIAGNGVLLLDEPTNHLDIAAIAWLETFLERFTGAVLVVSHDRYFLDRVATRILELERGTVESYPGNYSRYRQEKNKRDEARAREHALALARFEKEREYIDRMRAGVNARQAKGREKRLARFEMPEGPSGVRRPMRIELAASGRTSDTAVCAESVCKSYGGQAVLEDVSFTVRRGERVGIVGPNGCGKTTLLKILIGETAPDSGSARLGAKVRPGYYSQGMEGLTETNSVLDELWSAAPMSTGQEVRDLLGAFLFTGDDAAKNVGRLSGGEKGRLAVAKIVLAGANLLVLDEPTNHLDIPSREALEEAVSGFDGTVIAVSHDRFFLDRFARKIFALEGGRLTEHWGNYSDYAASRLALAAESAQAPSEGRRSWEDMKERRAAERMREKAEKNQARKISGIEERIAELEDALTALERELADPAVFGDYPRVAELTRRYDEARAARDGLYEQLEKELA